MSLIDDFKAACTMKVQTQTDDGEGGHTKDWVDGDTFQAAIVFDSSLQARVADKEGVTSLYTVTTDRARGLKFHDVFERLSDNKIFRVTSDGDDKLTPAAASFSFSQVTAEELEALPT